MHVISDVKAQCDGTLPLMSYIQADKYVRKNKNKYMFGLCVAIVSRGYFAKHQLTLLLIRHMYEDMDLRFGVKFEMLKWQDIDSLQ